MIKAFLDKNEPAVRSLSIDDQIDNEIVRELEQSGFFSSLYHAKWDYLQPTPWYLFNPTIQGRYNDGRFIPAVG